MESLQQRAETDGGALGFGYNLYKLVSDGVRQHPYNLAIICMHQPASHLVDLTRENTTRSQGPPSQHRPGQPQGSLGCLRWSHNNLFTAVRNVAFGLRQQGVKRGDTLATLIPNGMEWVVLMYASILLGLTFAPLDLGMVAEVRKEELANLMGLLKPGVIVMGDSAGASGVDKAVLASRIQPPVRVVLDPDRADDQVLSDWTPLASLGEGVIINATSVENLLDEASKDNPSHTALIYFTSGTSFGQPRGCPRTVANTTAAHYAQKDRLRFTPDSRFLLISANFRIISSLALVAWAKGAAIVLPDAKFSPGRTLDAIEQHRVTHMTLVPALLHALVSDPSFVSRDVSSISHCFLGGDIITKDVFFKAVKAFPQATVAVSHGMSEGGAIFAWPFWDVKPEAIPFLGEIAPLGIVAKGSKIRIVDDKTHGVELVGEPGELHLSSPTIIEEYLGGNQKEAFYDDAQGRWLITGDLAVMNADGLIYVIGRVKDRIKRAGVPITPAALESSIDKFTGSLSAVIGIPHITVGHEPFAVVKSLEDRSKEGVMRYVADLFGKDYALGGVVTLKDLSLESFPLNATGKVMKTDLQAQVLRYLSSK